MRWRILFGIGLVPVALFAHGQEPPRLLPASITGAKIPSTGSVSPASGTQASQVAPVVRFRDVAVYPPETTATLTGVRAGAEWLWRMNQPDGRFSVGLNPSARTLLPPDDDYAQAVAAAALAEAARFTGDDRLTARAVQAVLTLLTRTKPDATDPTCRVPTTDRNRVAFAALVTLAVGHLPDADARIIHQAHELTTFLQKQCEADGSIRVEPADDPTSAGLAIQALALSNRRAPEAGKADALTKAVGFYRASLRSKPDPLLAAALVPGLVDFALQTKGDRTLSAAVFEMTDALCDRQIVRIDPRNPAWTGGFSTAVGGPSHESAIVTVAVAHAAKLTRHVPDLLRYQRYRQATVAGLAFAQSLQFPEAPAVATETGFHAQYLAGGVRMSPSDETVRADATAHLVRAGLAFLQSGAEGRVE